MKEKLNLAVFVSAHGFGHAARCSAVMAAMIRMHPEIHFELFSETPKWFFLDSLPPAAFSYHSLKTDIGLVQESPLEEDIPATMVKLREFIPYHPAIVKSVSETIRSLNCRLALCDIAPLGLVTAHDAGLPSVLIENFTWDWIYRGYESFQAELAPYIRYMTTYFDYADFRIQAKPVCEYLPETIQVQPISRLPGQPMETTREKLGITKDRKTILVTLGGVPSGHDYVHQLKKFDNIDFILPVDADRPYRDGNCVILPHHSEFYHPDLVAASDAVIGKLGYSTLAEVYHAGIPYGFITRDTFRESIPLSRFVEQKMPGMRFDQAEFESGSWIHSIPRLLQMKRVERNELNGGEQAASVISKILDGKLAL